LVVQCRSLILALCVVQRRRPRASGGLGGQRTDHSAHTHSTIPGYCITGLAQATSQRQGHNTARLIRITSRDRHCPGYNTRGAYGWTGSVSACLVQLRMTVPEHAETVSQDVLCRPRVSIRDQPLLADQRQQQQWTAVCRHSRQHTLLDTASACTLRGT
jgi:hypothetical protein